jgi:hypothetical protein
MKIIERVVLIAEQNNGGELSLAVVSLLISCNSHAVTRQAVTADEVFKLIQLAYLLGQYEGRSALGV